MAAKARRALPHLWGRARAEDDDSHHGDRATALIYMLSSGSGGDVPWCGVASWWRSVVTRGDFLWSAAGLWAGAVLTHPPQTHWLLPGSSRAFRTTSDMSHWWFTLSWREHSVDFSKLLKNALLPGLCRIRRLDKHFCIDQRGMGHIA